MTRQPSLDRYTFLLVAASLVMALLVAGRAMAAEITPSQLTQRYAAWAGSRENARVLVHGLQAGTPVTLRTQGPRGASLAGFTPSAMSLDEAASALAQARADLSRAGISRPTAEQIQAAFVGGEVQGPTGRTRSLRGVAVAPALATPVASR